MPEDVRAEAVDVLLELPQQARLARARLAHDRDEVSTPVGARDLERVDDALELALAAYEGRLQPDAASRSAHRRDHAQGGPGLDRLLASLHLMSAGVLVGDGGLGGGAGHVVDQHGAGIGYRLEAR